MKVLIATDGSDFSRRAIEQAAALFGPGDGLTVKVLSCYEITLAFDAHDASVEYAMKVSEAERAEGEKTVAETAELVRKLMPKATVETELVVDYPERAIINQATDWKADVVVMGTHGRGFWGRLTLGSVSDAVVHHVPCSVFLGR